MPLSGFKTWLEKIDISRFATGTLDSICEDTLTTYRDPGDAPPVLVEGFVGNALLARAGMFPSGAHTDATLEAYLAPFTLDGQPPQGFGEKLAICRALVDRLIEDQVDLGAYGGAASLVPGRRSVVNILRSYRTYMEATGRMDFAGLEEVFLDRLRQGRLNRFTSAIQAILIDEYQDTNPLQESIYFELATQTRGSVTVVGDDDQSLYRFRGATVELFCHFPPRLMAAVPSLPSTAVKALVDNYRSTPEVVGFFNQHIACDGAFGAARVAPPKPQIVGRNPSNGLPVLGLFRANVQTLAQDLAAFLLDVFRGRGHTVRLDGRDVCITRHAEGGDIGDAVVLAHTVNEFRRGFRGNPPRPRLPFLLRQALEARGVGVFNPRGQALRDIGHVQRLLGLVLECVDRPTASHPEGTQQTGAPLRRNARDYLNAWRTAARSFMATNPAPNSPYGLGQFVQAWQTRTNQTDRGAPWPAEWPVLELCYKLIAWMPIFQDDPEGQVYLEAVSRCIAQASTFSSYRSNVVHGFGQHDERSVGRVIMDIMAPLAENGVEVDEEIMPHVPRNQLPLMTIHQAKGLEFPLVIVDVASDYGRDHTAQRFRRFPDGPTATQLLEDEVSPYCAIGPFRAARPARARAFDDLTRLYYVAYSRAQSVLMLVGVDRCLRYNTSIRHVATGWRSDSTWSWQVDVSGKAPTIANAHPLKLI
jgi:DNA helicase-2/ATP-dependent DNA helicase PcrA